MIASCPSCATRYDVDPSRLKGGRGRLRCARCKTLFPVEIPAAADAPRVAGRRLDVGLVAAEAGEVRDAIVTTLAEASVRTIIAETGPAALETARRSRPRLAILAHYLPGLIGPEVAAAIRDDPSLAATRVVLLGGPPPRGRHAATADVVHDVDGHLPDDASPEAAAGLFRTLLGLPRGAEAVVPKAEIEALARAAASDLRLYHGDVVERCRSLRRRTPEFDALLAWARSGCAARLPAARNAPAALDAFGDSLVQALGL